MTHISDLPDEVMAEIMRSVGSPQSYRATRQAKDYRSVNRAFKLATDTMLNEQPEGSRIDGAMKGARWRRYRDEGWFPDRSPVPYGPKHSVGDLVYNPIQIDPMLYRVIGKPSAGKTLVVGTYDGKSDTCVPPSMAPTIVKADDLWVKKRRKYHHAGVHLDDKSPMAGSTLMARQRRGVRKAPTRKAARTKVPKRAPARPRKTGRVRRR